MEITRAQTPDCAKGGKECAGQNRSENASRCRSKNNLSRGARAAWGCKRLTGGHPESSTPVLSRTRLPHLHSKVSQGALPLLHTSLLILFAGRRNLWMLKVASMRYFEIRTGSARLINMYPLQVCGLFMCIYSFIFRGAQCEFLSIPAGV